MAAAPVIAAFLCDPDQPARRAELRAFIGPNAELFLQTYDGMQAAAVSGTRQRFFGRHWGIVVLAFFLGPCWYCYRKLWTWACGVAVLMAVVAFLPTTRLGVPIGVVLAMSGHTVYLQHAMVRIAELRGDAAVASFPLLQQEGGVAKQAGWISGVLVGLLYVALTVAIVSLNRSSDLLR